MRKRAIDACFKVCVSVHSYAMPGRLNTIRHASMMRTFFHTGLQLAFKRVQNDVTADLVQAVRVGLRVLADQQSER